MYKRLELHNHTTESDANITCNELIEHMMSDEVDAFAITDHNTTSGHYKIRARLKELDAQIECIYGMEYTTYYGHIHCLNLNEYVPWDNINRHKPELLFMAAKEKGALVGIAHPFSYGDPFARGCRFEMTVSDYSVVDFIEIFNNPEPLHRVNEPALALWEKLVLEGNHIAATSGMDLHGRNSFADKYATFIEGNEGGVISYELEEAIHSCRTWVSRGPLLISSYNEAKGCITFSVIKSHKSGFEYPEAYSIVLKTPEKEMHISLTANESMDVCLSEFDNAKIIIPKLYGATTKIEDLYCVSPVIYI